MNQNLTHLLTITCNNKLTRFLAKRFGEPRWPVARPDVESLSRRSVLPRLRTVGPLTWRLLCPA